MTELQALLERVEAATESDRQLNRDIHFALTGFDARRAGLGWPDENADVVPVFPGWMLLPDYTGSLDAITALIKERLPWFRLSLVIYEISIATLEHPGFYAIHRADAATPALALCAAFLKVLIAQEREDG